jgi:hypothetical protein
MYIYTNNKFLQKQPSANPMAWYEMNMLSEKNMLSIFDVDDSLD